MTLTSILVPFRSDGGARAERWEWVKSRYQLLFPEAEIVVADSTLERFNLSEARNNAARGAQGDVFVIADADTAFDEDWLRSAVHFVRARKSPWILPSHYLHLDAVSTSQLLIKSPAAEITGYRTMDRTDFSWSGVIVVPRQAFVTVGGYDERHVGWGWEDICFGLSVDTLWGRNHRIEGNVYHLWHPATRAYTIGQPDYLEQKLIFEAYHAAEGDHVAMRKVIDER